MTTGMTLGKFAPLHRGHQSVIERAIAENDHVIVVIYHVPETTTVPLPVRAGWIRELYPNVEVLEAWDGPVEVGNTPEIEQRHEAYLNQLLAGRTITRFYSSEFYGEHVSRALSAEDCRVDPDRLLQPVSATQVRQNPYACRNFLHPRVYRDLVTWVCLLGAPSTGKTTLSAALADQFGTVVMPEYGREYWEKYQQNRRLTAEQLLEIAVEHRRIEEQAVAQANRFFFVDTDATTTAIFSELYHQMVLPELAELAREAISRYDVCLLCDSDIPYDDTWDRSGAGSREIFQSMIKANLIASGRTYVTISGSLPSRLKSVSTILEGYDKWTSLCDQLIKPNIDS